ncbi:mitochondrial import receptor subunit TOM70-like [Brevipalpus obovatus]|uniref:mitochondrial import receptor subunit TOM70-like n=1 Tax=Brevipalpus obovatus TaxID=246614 RepID=UPI003D9E0422
MNSSPPSRKRMKSSEDSNEASIEKEKGNEHFKAGAYSEAIECYSKSIESDPTNPIVFGNRAQAYLNMKMPREAELDCDSAISLDSKFIKGYYRRGLARKMLNKLKFALEDFEKTLELDPKNIQCGNEIKTIHKQLLLEQKSTKTLRESGDNRPKMKYFPTQVPSNPYYFYQDWRELDEDGQNKLKYLKMIGGSTLGTIFDSSILEPNIWIEIINILEKENDSQFTLEILHGLCKTKNSSSLLLFLEKDERTKIYTMINSMKERRNLDQESIEFVIKTLKIE